MKLPGEIFSSLVLLLRFSVLLTQNTLDQNQDLRLLVLKGSAAVLQDVQSTSLRLLRLLWMECFGVMGYVVVSMCFNVH